jgi:putative acetyltransferase
MLLVRDETPADIDAIADVTVEAFKSLAISSKTEQFIIRELRAVNALTLSLVAEIEGQVVGHVAFSPVEISDGSESWYGLGPLSVLPESQRKGIGKALVEAGLSRLHTLRAQGCCLVGDPRYYNRFGFRSIPGLVYEGIPQEYVLALPLIATIPQGAVTFHKAFQATE